jgi:23S rRNA pseudouridine2605 synthase
MRKRSSSGTGKGGRRNSSGRGDARSSSTSNKSGTSSKRSESKPRGDRGESKRSFSKASRSEKPYRKSDASDSSSRSERPYKRSRTERDDSARPSKFSRSRKDDSREYTKGRGEESIDRRSQKPTRKSDSRFSSETKRPYKTDDTRGRSKFSRSRDDHGDTKRSSKFQKEDSKDFKKEYKSERSEKPKERGSFFSKLTRGGKAFDRKHHDADFGKSVKDFSRHKQESQDATSDKIRLNKYISNSGVCSRREADELITMGLVTVNGKVITELGYKVNRGDVVKYDGKTLRAEKPVYILLNKPKGYLTTTKDPQERNTVMHIIANAVKERVYPVGRLDRNTTGLLLLTNDGELTDKLSHPSYNVKKIYKVDLDKPLTKADFQKILEGVQLEEGRAIVDDLAIVSPDGKTIGVELHIGWNRVVRRIFERLEYTVIKLDRTIYAGLDKKDLARGQWRFLTQEEIVRLKHYK